MIDASNKAGLGKGKFNNSLVSWGFSAIFASIKIDGTLHIAKFTAKTLHLINRFLMDDDNAKIIRTCNVAIEIRRINTKGKSSLVKVASDGMVSFSGLVDHSTIGCTTLGNILRRCVNSDRLPLLVESLEIVAPDF